MNDIHKYYFPRGRSYRSFFALHSSMWVWFNRQLYMLAVCCHPNSARALAASIFLCSHHNYSYHSHCLWLYAIFFLISFCILYVACSLKMQHHFCHHWFCCTPTTAHEGCTMPKQYNNFIKLKLNVMQNVDNKTTITNNNNCRKLINILCPLPRNFYDLCGKKLKETPGTNSSSFIIEYP